MKKTIFTSFMLLIASMAVAQDFQPFVENGKYGLKDGSQKTILTPQFDYICTKTIYADQKLLVRIADSCFLINPTTKTTSPLCDLPQMRNQTLCPAIIAAGDKYGYVDQKGTVIIDGQWDFASTFCDGVARVVNGSGWALDAISQPSSGVTGYIDTLGRYVIPLEYSFIDYFDCQIPVTRFTRGRYLCTDHLGCENPYKGSKWGLIDKNGKIIVADKKYDFIDRPVMDQKSGTAVFGVVRGKKMGLIDASGTEILPLAPFASLKEMWTAYLK